MRLTVRVPWGCACMGMEREEGRALGHRNGHRNIMSKGANFVWTLACAGNECTPP